MDLLRELGTGVVCGDGAIGTLLLDAGVPIECCFEELCVSEPERIQKIHEDYAAAGARVIKTNTFGANSVRLGRFGMEKRVAEINRAAVAVARRASKNEDVCVAGSVGPLGITRDEADAQEIDRPRCFAEQITALLESGVDVICFETFTYFEEMQLAFMVKEQLGDAPAIYSFACAPDGRLHCGTRIEDALDWFQHRGAIVGVNCMNTPREMSALMQHVPNKSVLAVYPTAGKSRDGIITPEEFAAFAPDLTARGARLLGGCCGTTPDHIAALAAAISKLPS